MARLDESAGLNVLRDANRSLGEFLARNAEAVQGSDDVQAMLEVERTLRAVGSELERLQRIDRPDVRLELELYRDNLVRLRRQLAIMQSAATECQARLFVRQKHLRAAQEWCAATRTTG
jgi:hypothetical protein